MKYSIFWGFFGFLLLLSVPAYGEMMSVNVAQTSVKAGPGKDSKIIFTAYKHFPVKILKQSGNWILVEDFEGQGGWMDSDDLSSKLRTCIVKSSGGVNMRKGPGKNTPVIRTAGYGVAFKVIENIGGWIHVKHDQGAAGWIYKSLLWGEID